MKDNRVHLIHICECIERIERYTEGGKDFFFSDDKTQDAVLRNLHTLSESTQRLSPALKASHPEVDWRGMRDFETSWYMTTLVSIWSAYGRLLSDTCRI